MTSVVVVISAKGFSGWGVTPVYSMIVLVVKVAARDMH